MKLKIIIALQLLFLKSLMAMPDASTDMTAAKNWARDLHLQGESEFAQTGWSRQASAEFWGEQIIYQIQVDRFNNGDKSNDLLNIEDRQRQEMPTGDLYGVMDYRHGGDIEGIRQRLSYIKNLGVTSLWITPVFKHNGAYHGYCTTDFTQTDPGFGSKDELRRLVHVYSVVVAGVHRRSRW